MDRHFHEGHPVMVDVSTKSETARTAVAEARLRLPFDPIELADRSKAKGDAVTVAEIAGIQGAKRTADLIPLCHPLPLSSVTVLGRVDGRSVIFTATCKTTGRTGVEMEAMTAASISALTLYDMWKGTDAGIVIESVRLLSKEGGKSGRWSASDR